MISFAFNEKHIHEIRKNKLYLVKWGFSYDNINEMPLDEYFEYLDLINKHNKDENDAIKGSQNGTSDGGPPQPHPIGMVAPRAK